MSKLAIALTISVALHLLILLWPGPHPHQRVSVLQVRVSTSVASDSPTEVPPPQAPTPATSRTVAPDTAHTLAQENQAPAPDVAPKSGNRETTLAPSPAPAERDDVWLSQVRRLLAERVSYPARARLLGMEGTAWVSFQVAATGEIGPATLTTSSGHAPLDRAALALVAEQKLPPPPPHFSGKTITAPVQYTLAASRP